MARFIPSKKTEYDFNDAEKYINKIDVVQADTINNLVEAVLYQQENSLEENKVKILTVKQDYTFESSESTVSNNYNYQSFGGEQTFELIITATEAGNEIEVLEHAQISFRAAGFETYSDYTFKGNYSGEEGSIVFDDPISYEEDGFNLIKIVVHMSWNGQVASQIEISVRIKETKKTLLPPTELQFPINNESEIKFNNFDSALESANRLVIQGTRVGAFENPSLSGDITLKGGKNVTVEQDGKTITFNSENPNAILEGDITVYTDTAGEDSHTFPLEKGSKLRFHGFNTELESENHLIIEGTRLKADGYFAFTSGDIVLKGDNGIGISQAGNEITFVGSSTPVITDYVTLGTEQTITGNKTFTGGLTYGDWQTLGIGLSRDGVFVYAEGTAYKIYFPQKEGTVALEEDIPTQYVKSVNGRSGELMLSKSDLGLAHALLYDEQKLTAEEQKQARDNLGIGDVVTSINGKTGEVIISKNDLGLGRVAITNDYNDLDNKPSIPTDYVTRTTVQTVSGTKTFTSLAGIIAQDPSTNEEAILTHGSLVLGIGNKSASSSSPRDYLSIFPTYIARAKDQGGSSGDSYAYNFPNKSGTFALQEDIPTIPINHVTTDTQQVISGVKTFTSGVNVKNSSSDTYTAYYGSYYMMISHNSSEYQVSYPTKAGALALTSDIKSYTQGTGVSISSSNVISTTAASSTASGHVTTGTQTFAGRKTFNGGINIPSGATIQLNGSSGTAGYVLTSNGTSSAPSWQAVSSGSAAYPIGAYYISHSSTSPAILFGGSWTSVTGKFLYCNAGTSTGGSNTHTLTVNEMPSHNHNELVDKDTNKPIGRGYGAGKAGWKLTGFSETSNFGGGIRADNTGGGSSFSIMPAYQSCYAWRRTA